MRVLKVVFGILGVIVAIQGGLYPKYNNASHPVLAGYLRVRSARQLGHPIGLFVHIRYRAALIS